VGICGYRGQRLRNCTGLRCWPGTPEGGFICRGGRARFAAIVSISVDFALASEGERDSSPGVRPIQDASSQRWLPFSRIEHIVTPRQISNQLQACPIPPSLPKSVKLKTAPKPFVGRGTHISPLNEPAAPPLSVAVLGPPPAQASSASKKGFAKAESGCAR